MNILFLNSIPKETYGGMEEWIRLAATGLAAKGHRAIVSGREGSEYIRRAGADKSVERLELPISGDFNPATILRLAKFISDNSVDIVTVNFNKDVRLGGLAAQLTKDAAVIWSIGLDITKDSFAHRMLTPRLIDGVVVPSRALATQIQKNGYILPDQIQVIPIGIPEATEAPSHSEVASKLRERYSLPDDSIIAVTCGRLVDEKGHCFLVDAATLIVGEYPQIRFLILGDGPLRSRLENSVAAKMLQRNFIFAGMQDDVTSILPGANLMIHPSVEEWFGIAILEGMRAGLPIITSRVGGIPEVTGDASAAALVEPRNADSLAEAVLKLLGDPDRIRSAGATARQRWEDEFKMTTMIDRIEEYFGSFTRAESRG